eukprot:g66943.t1
MISTSNTNTTQTSSNFFSATSAFNIKTITSFPTLPSFRLRRSYQLRPATSPLDSYRRSLLLFPSLSSLLPFSPISLFFHSSFTCTDSEVNFNPQL